MVHCVDAVALHASISFGSHGQRSKVSHMSQKLTYSFLGFTVTHIPT